MSPCAACLTAALDNDLEVPAYGRDVREPKATIDGLTVVAFMKTLGPADADLCHGSAPGSQSAHFAALGAATKGRELLEGEAVENVVLEFKPRPTQDMWTCCLPACGRTGKGRGRNPYLLSFALITDEPPEEVAAAGHDRCVIPIKPEHVDAWLNPDSRNLKALYAILDDKAQPYYEHRWLLAA